MTNFVQLQEDLTALLLAKAELRDVGVVQFRKLRVGDQINWAQIWQAGRCDKNGAGILVEMPTATCDKPDMEGPQLDLNCHFTVVELPELNLNPTLGTMVSAEEIAQWILDALHLQTITGQGQLVSAPTPITPSDDFTGCVCYRVTLRLMNPRAETPRVGYIAAHLAEDGTCTLTPATAGCAVYFTLDGSCPSASNSAAQIYTAPFAVGTASVLRYAGYKTGFNPSSIFLQNIT